MQELKLTLKKRLGMEPLNLIEHRSFITSQLATVEIAFLVGRGRNRTAMRPDIGERKIVGPQRCAS